MINKDGYRPNVGIVVINRKGQVLWARRVNQNSWQFPQGGVDVGETPTEAMYRELYEELGVKECYVNIISTSKHWYRYKLPKRMIRADRNGYVCLGQKQKWFLISIESNKLESIAFNKKGHPEFDGWRWVSYWYPIRQVVSFKRDVYRRVLTEFAQSALFL